MERKIDSKLEKLESKAMKLKKKMTLLRSSDSEGANPSGMNAFDFPIAKKEHQHSKLMFDAVTAGKPCSTTTVPHMSGGETYKQQWEVINTGEMPWTSKARLQSLI